MVRSVRLVIIGFCLVGLTSPAWAQSPLLGQLQPGPYGVGFKVTEKLDPSRPYRFPFDLDGRPRQDVARPMQISVWYPAAQTTAARMRLSEYVRLMAREQRFDVPAAVELRLGEQTLFALPTLRDVPADARARLLDLTTNAVRDAPPASGRFPLILFSLGSPAVYQASAEFLASHGYVVAIMPRLPETRSLVDTVPTRADFESKARDMAFLINEMSQLPSVDLKRIGVTGFSAGGRWAIGEAMRNPMVTAVLSLDSVMLFDDDGGEFRQMPFVQPERVRAPVLHMIRREWVPQERASLWQEMRYAPREEWVFEQPGLDHWDFASIGYATAVAGYRTQMAEAVSETFHVWNRAMLAFFEAYVKADSQAVGKLAGGPAAFGARADAVTVSRLPGAPEVPTASQFTDAIVDDVKRGLARYRASWKERGEPPVPEATLNLTGYELLARGRPQDAVEVLALNAEVFPQSANVWDSLADAYLAAGDRAKALEFTQKALALLPADPSPPARKAAIEQSIRQKLAQLKGSGVLKF